MMSLFTPLLAAGLAAFPSSGEEPGGDARREAPGLSLTSSGDFDELLHEESPFPPADPEGLGSFRPLHAQETAPLFSLIGETGTYLKELRFRAIAEDGAPRSISGIGLIPVEVEGSFRLGSQWSIGVGALGAFSQNVEMWGFGPQITWRLWSGHASAPSKPPETEHFLKAGVFWEVFQVTESGFGSFKSTAAPQIGYQFRTPMGGEGWTFQLDVRYEYAAFRYSEPVLSGDRWIRGNGLFFGIGAGILF